MKEELEKMKTEGLKIPDPRNNHDGFVKENPSTLSDDETTIEQTFDSDQYAIHNGSIEDSPEEDEDEAWLWDEDYKNKTHIRTQIYSNSKFVNDIAEEKVNSYLHPNLYSFLYDPI